MVLRFLVAIVAVFSLTAFADNFTNVDAGAYSFVSGIGQGALTYVAKAKLSALFSERLVTNPVPKQLTPEEAKQMIAKLEGSFFARRGIGQWGGSEFEVVYDKERVNRSLGADSATDVNKRVGGTATTNVATNSASASVDAAEKAKPVMTTETFKIRLLGSPEDTKAKIMALQESGAAFSTAEVRTFIRGPGLRLVSGTLMVLFAANTASNAYRAWNFSQSWKASPAGANVVDQCKGKDSNDCKVSWYSYSWLWDTADSVFYTFHADK